VLDDPRSFAEALRATETYIRSKINKGKGDVVGGPGGKLERLEAKVSVYRWVINGEVTKRSDPSTPA